MTQAIDLALLPHYDPVPQLSVDEITAAKVQWWRDEYGVSVGGPEDPRYRQIRAQAYREHIIRQDLNEAHKNQLLAYAKGAALDHLGVTRYRVPRLDGEDYEVYRQRLAQAPDGFSAAGPEGAYVFFARSVSSDVLDVSYDSPAPNNVTLTVLAADTADEANILDMVAATFRKQGDVVTVNAAEKLNYTVNAALELHNEPGGQVVLDAANAALQAYCDSEYRLEGVVTLDGLYAALRQPGVKRAAVTGWEDIEADKFHVPYAAALNVVLAGV